MGGFWVIEWPVEAAAAYDAALALLTDAAERRFLEERGVIPPFSRDVGTRSAREPLWMGELPGQLSGESRPGSAPTSLGATSGQHVAVRPLSSDPQQGAGAAADAQVAVKLQE